MAITNAVHMETGRKAGELFTLLGSGRVLPLGRMQLHHFFSFFFFFFFTVFIRKGKYMGGFLFCFVFSKVCLCRFFSV